ncbi:PREDICTED: lactoylglutathione lyase [Ipomoea nil]|uniref:lactoylglutathione lyase n=1 Tax=Ipomoea nil TaxID=35883 RepID=UPI000900CBD6|nr:PREDICTED: lactoylglutathione lyase [Ipomoea nil]
MQSLREERSHSRKLEEDDETPSMALNHVSRLCRSVKDSVDFYTKVLGLVEVERPPAFDGFDGAWLFNYGVGIHLVQAKDGDQDRLPHPTDQQSLDPMDNHISFQCDAMEAMERRLKELKVKYMKRTVGEGEGEAIDQLFFKDPDGFMIEICNCENITLVPQPSLGKIKLPSDRHTPPVQPPEKSYS